MIGQIVSHYKILEHLGGGGMGVVYKAEDTKLKRTVALKFLPPAFSQDPEAKARFIHEAQAASSLQHNNICNVHDIDESPDGQMFIVMDLYEGETLKSRIAPARQQESVEAGGKGGLKIEEAIDITVQVAQGLQKAHEKDIVHRDIKPANIIVTRDGIAKILDFGLAKLAGQTRLTKTGSTVGTAGYMSPEQAQGNEVDHRTDIWSLGVVLYEMLTGKLPFRGEHDAAIIYSIMNEEPSPLSKSNINASEELQTIVSRTLAKEKEGRYQKVGDLLTDLRSELDRLEGKTQAPAGGRMSVGPKAARLKKVLRKPLGIVIALVCVVAIVWIAASVLLSNKLLKYESFEIKKLTHSGDIDDAAISPDGNYVAYSISGAASTSLYMRHIESADQVKLMDFGDKAGLMGIDFSPDGNYLYFVRVGGLFRLPRIGGDAKALKSNAQGKISIAPDGKQLAISTFDSLSVAIEILKIDGTGGGKKISEGWEFSPRVLRRIPGGRSWSPDGRLLALKQEGNDGFGMVIHDLIDSTEKDILRPVWPYIGSVVWAPDGKSLLFIGKKTKPAESQIWSLSYPDGEVRQITSDPNGFHKLGSTIDGKSLLATQAPFVCSLFILPYGDEAKIQKVSTGEQELFTQIGWTADNRLLFVSTISRDYNLNALYPDGSKLTTLYSDTIFISFPKISKDNRTIYFGYGGGNIDSVSIWRVDIETRTRQRVFRTRRVYNIELSSDGGWIFIDTENGLVKLRADGQQVQTYFKPMIGERGTFYHVLSPDGTRIACIGWNQKLKQRELRIVDAKTSELQQTIPIQVWDYRFGLGIQWSPDGRGILYLDGTNGAPNIWMKSLAGGQPKQITHFPSDDITDFGWSPDGKYLAVVRMSNPSDLFLLTPKQ